ncbi:MAG: SDR family oxidoreductase [Polyangiaceae bacterium]
MSDKASDLVTIVTGANTGIGKATALELARRGYRTFIACRSLDKARAAADEIRATVPGATVDVLELDLGSLASVRQAAATFLETGLPLPLLVNNAGVAGQRGLTKDGFELHFGTNHLGHFLFTMLLLPRIVQSAPARIVNVSSGSHYQAKGIDFDRLRDSTRSITGLPEYEVSKLANVFFTQELAERLKDKGVTTYAVHPGTVASDAWRRIPWPIRSLITMGMISNEEGAKTSLHCATSEEAGRETGLYYDKCKPKKASRVAADLELSRRLWRASEEWVGL